MTSLDRVAPRTQSYFEAGHFAHQRACGRGTNVSFGGFQRNRTPWSIHPSTQRHCSTGSRGTCAQRMVNLRETVRLRRGVVWRA